MSDFAKAVEEARKAFVSEIARLTLTGERAGPDGQAVRAYRALEAALRRMHFAEAADALDQRNDHLQALLEAKAKEQGTSFDRDHHRAWKDAAQFLRGLP